MQDEGQNTPNESVNWQFKPGDTIAPGGAAAPAAPAPQTPPAQPVSQPQQPPGPVSQPEQPAPATEESYTEPPAAPVSDAVVSWTASEFMTHGKSFGWYFLLGLAAVAAAVVIYFVTRGSIMSAVTVLLAGILLGAFAFMTRKPRTLHYQVSSTGVQIESKVYPYNELKAFAIQPQGPINAIVLIPTKRFMPPITMYYDQKDEDKIADTLNDHLAFDDEHNDPVDNFMRRIRF